MTQFVKSSFQENYPFITCLVSLETEYIGIVINFDHSVTSLYDYGSLRTQDEKDNFLLLGESWWWESNRKIPINIFLKQEMLPFKPYIKTFNSKDIKILFGPTVNLGNITEKRIKRKSIQLLKNPKKARP